MSIRDKAPVGAPCWADLFTSDVEGTRAFYSELFGWQAQPPDPEFGGYFLFTRDGVPVAGAMGSMPDMPATDAWTVYLTTDDIAGTVAAAEKGGARIVSPAMAVADLGSQAILVDPTGAHLGAWQPGTFGGFTVLGEHGAPSWFELYTRDHAGAVAFYRDVFRWHTESMGDTDEFRYTTMRDPGGGEYLAGIMDAARYLPDGAPPHWRVYWYVADLDAALGTVTARGGSVLQPAQDSPYGTIATVADPAGAQFTLHARNS